MTRTYFGEPLRVWRQMPWWPNGVEARVAAGPPGHDYEIVVNAEGYEHPGEWPDLVVEVLAALLPETWKIESRTTRVEIHPSGHFAGGYAASDVVEIERALREMGFEVKT